MKKIAFLCVLVIAIVLSGCQPSKVNESTAISSYVWNTTDISASHDTADSSTTETSAQESMQIITRSAADKSGTSQSTTLNTHQISYSKLESGIIDTPQEKKFLALKGKTVTIATESAYDTYSDQIKTFYENLEKKYGVTFKFFTLSGSEQQTKIAQLVASGDAPDVCHSSYVLILRYIYGNVIQSMNPFIDKSDAVWNHYKWTLSMYDWNGSLYALPFAGTACAYMVYYNKTLFEENNVKTPLSYYNEGNWNFDTFYECAKNMTLYRADGVTTKTYGVFVPVQMVFCLANGEPGINVDENGEIKITIDSQAGISGLKLLSNLYKNGYCGDGDFAQRKVAMDIDRQEYLIGINNLYSTMEDEIGMVPIPQGDTDTRYCPMGADGYAIPKNCKNPLGGMMFMYESYMQNQSNEYRGLFSGEHYNIYMDYIRNSVPSFTNIESLAGWWDAGYKGDFWRSIQAGKSPESAIDSMKSVLKTAIRRTAG